MDDSDSQRRPFQYSLWSLFVLTTVVAVLCSVGVSAHWIVSVMLAAGIYFCFLGFGIFSFRKHADVGCGFIVWGFLFRLIGMGLVAFGLVLWIVKAAWRLR